MGVVGSHVSIVATSVASLFTAESEVRAGNQTASVQQFCKADGVDCPLGLIHAPCGEPPVLLRSSLRFPSLRAKSSRLSTLVFPYAVAVPVSLSVPNVQIAFPDNLTSLTGLPKNHSEFPELLLKDGDILFNRTNSADLVGKTVVYFNTGHPTSFASYLIRIHVIEYLPELLSAYINSGFGRDWVRSVVNQQVGQANVNGTKLRELGVPLLPMDEQKELWSRIKKAFAAIDHVANEATRATDLLDRLDQRHSRQGVPG
jgi:hypothetical protein